jgi:hypothetical protein
MTGSWLLALNEYRYPVFLKDFRNALRYPPYFNQSISGDRDSTISFESYFRTTAGKIEPWYEVVFWKLYSQKRIAQQKTEDIIRQLSMHPKVEPEDLLESVEKFIASESRNDFNAFRQLFRFRSNAIAVVATFPAFFRPEKFPMVDTRVAKWVNMHCRKFNAANPDGPQLIPSEYGNNSYATVLTMNDYSFYLRWIHWTRYAAERLTSSTGKSWRPRDVEMAVFTAWGDRGNKHPVIHLNPSFDERKPE